MSSYDYSGDTMVLGLRILAGLLIFGGTVAAIVIWTIFGSVEVVTDFYSDDTTTEVNPMGIILAIATGFQALLIGFFLLVFAKLVESVGRIESAITSQIFSPAKPEVAVESGTGGRL